MPTLVVMLGFPTTQSSSGLAVRGAILTLFWLVAPGAAVLAHLRHLTSATRAALTPTLGLCALIALGTLGAWTGLWIPGLATVGVAVSCLISGLTVLRGAKRARARHVELRRSGGTTAAIVALLCLSTVLWVAALTDVDRAPPSVLGLLAAGPRTLPVALLLTAVSFVLALRAGRPVVIATAVAALILVLRTTATLVDSVPTAAWTYKHLGVVSALQEHHHTLPGSDIYMNWPGMFAASAYLSDSSGVPVIELARWISPIVHVLLALSTAAVARALGSRTPGCIAAAGLVVIFNWVGQDYFSPQAVAMCLAAGLVVTLVQSRRNPTCGVLSIVIYAVIVTTHQLTPFWLLGMAFGLLVIRRIRLWVFAGMLAALALYIIPRIDVIAGYGLFTGFNPVGNATINVAPVPALGRDVGGWFSKASALLMWTSAAAVIGLRLWSSRRRHPWRRRNTLAAAVITFSPFLLLGGQSYGGEAILRVTLYSTLGSAAVLGPALVRAVQGMSVRAVAASVWLVLVLGATGQAAYSLWWVNYIRPEDVTAAQWLAEQSPGAYVTPVNLDWPGRGWLDYARYFEGADAETDRSLEVALETELPADPFVTQRPVPLDEAEVSRLFEKRPSDRPSYLVFTAATRAYDEYYRTFAEGSYQDLLDQVQVSENWRMVRHEGDLWVFQYRGARSAD